MNNCSAFDGDKCISRGNLYDTAAGAHDYLADHPDCQLLIFDGAGRQIDLDLRGSKADVQSRLPVPTVDNAAPEPAPAKVSAPRTAGRPRLGVVAREVTLLPRHWEWLASQAGGASVSLRKLVEKAIRENKDTDRVRQGRDAAYRFMHSIAGDLAGFEEANRALYAGDRTRFTAQTAQWPDDIRQHALLLADESWAD